MYKMIFGIVLVIGILMATFGGADLTFNSHSEYIGALAWGFVQYFLAYWLIISGLRDHNWEPKNGKITLKQLDDKWWYRLLKVAYFLLFLLFVFFAYIIGDSAYTYYEVPAILILFEMIILEGVRRGFYYVVTGIPFPKKE